MRLRHLASQLGCELVGDGEIEISGVAGMEHAVPGQLTFLANLTYAPKVKRTKASAILVSEPVRDAGIASGAQILSTDYPFDWKAEGSGFHVTLGSESARCNPVNAPAGCRIAALERVF